MKALFLMLVATGASAQTMIDQEKRLIDIHSLLMVLQPEAPGAYAPWQLGAGLEVITIPPIDGTTGGRRQMTASDHTPLFPRPRLALGLPAPADFRAWAGLAYIPPIALREVSAHLGALELGMAWDGGGPVSAGVRVYGVLAEAKSPVTDPSTRDTLDTTLFGADVSGAYRFDLGRVTLTPFAGVGVTHVAGDFHVTSDDALVTSRSTVPGLDAGVRFVMLPGIAAVAEWVVFPGRLVHPVFSISWVSQGRDRNAR